MESFKDVWALVKEQCQKELSEVAYNLWICCIEDVEFKDGEVLLYVKNSFQKTIIMEKYTMLLKNSFETILGFEIELSVVAPDESKEESAEIEKQIAQKLEPKEKEENRAGDYEFTFDTFIVGSSNKFAHAAALAVATNPSSTYNPLFIYGDSGLGKTHLLFAIGNEISKNNKNLNIVYVKAEEFTNELIEAIGNETTYKFHAKYRSADVLLVDDIQFIAGKDSTQEEFFHTFNTLHHAGKQIVLTSDRPPKEIKTLEDRLRTRFEWGLIADITVPDFETRIAIIRRKAEMLQINIPDDVAEYIANRLKSNIRQLEGTVKKLKAYMLLANIPPTIGLAQTSINDILNDNQPVPITIEKIINEVSRTYSVSPSDIKSNKRNSNISKARQVAIYVVREITQMSMASIGEEFGGRDHSTIVYALNQVEKEMKNNSFFRETVEDIIKNIRDN